MEFKDEDWRRLAAMRSVFLAAREKDVPTERSYRWRDERDLELYDATFGARIAWKWRAVLDELARVPDFALEGPIVDWGCGTGVASRAVLARFGARTAAKPIPDGAPPLVIHAWDRSPLARRFARAQIERDCATAGIQCAVHEGAPPSDVAPHLVLVSHVLGELDGRGLAELAALVARARFCVWVEPGDRDTSRRLSRVRETLLSSFDALAPCTHQAACGALAAGAERHWCHHFARPPSEVFRSAMWARFADELGIDLRSLPYSYLVLRRRASAPDTTGATGAARAEEATQGTGESRILGRPRVTKGKVQLDRCDASGVRTVSLLARDAPQLFRMLEDAAGERLVFRFQESGDRVKPV